MTRRALVLVLLAVPATRPAPGAAQELAYTGSVQFSSGSYIFTEPTRTLSLYNGLTLTTGRLRLGATVPVIFQNSGAVTMVGGGYLPTGGPEHGAVGGREQGQQVPMGPGGPRRALVSLVSGYASQLADSVVQEPASYEPSLGDPLLSGGLELYRGADLLRSVELTAALKPPINDLESGVGTGAWDVAMGGAVAAALGPVVTFLDLTYWWYGDLPELELRDGPSFGGGLGLPLSRKVWVSAMATGTNRIIESAEAALSASLGLSYSMAGTGTLSVSAGAGLSETSPDYSFSVGWRRSLLD